jgi:gliding motility-associated lipoprotein GldH
MRKVFVFFLVAFMASACDEDRVYEKNVDFDDRFWPVSEKPEFEFDIVDNAVNYNLYCNIRNSVSFPYSRIFINYSLEDSSGVAIQKQLTPAFLFDQHSGKPQGTSGLGDIYDQRIPLLKNYHFNKPGKYRVRFEQYMRTDSLQGILAVGLRVEKTAAN